MTKDLEFKGYWFLPNNPNDKIAGTLYYQLNKEIRLELIGGFENISAKNLPFESAEIIHGISQKAEEITLFNCNAYGSLNLSCGFPMTNFTCQFIIIGKHMSTINDEIFNKIVVNLSSLFDWHPQGMIKQLIQFSNDRDFFETQFSLSKSDYWEKEVSIDSNTKLKIHNISGFNQSFDKRETILTQDILCEIESVEKKSNFTDLLNKAGLFKQFLSFASLSSQEFLEIILFDNDNYQEFNDGCRNIHPITLYYINKDIKISDNKTSNFLFTYSDIEKIFPNIIKKWFDVKSEFAPIKNHLIESLKRKKVFTSLDFLIIVQALEGYHRRFVNKEIKLKRGESELTLRLADLISIYSDIDKICNTKINLTHVVKSRNYYVSIR